MAIPKSIFLYLSLYDKNDATALELRRVLTNPDEISLILYAALRDEPIIIYPLFRNKVRAVGILKERGIIKQNSKTAEYRLTQ